MNADPEVMLDQGGPLSREESDAKLDRYAAAFARHGFCRWLTESRDGALRWHYAVAFRPSTRSSC